MTNTILLAKQYRSLASDMRLAAEITEDAYGETEQVKSARSVAGLYDVFADELDAALVADGIDLEKEF